MAHHLKGKLVHELQKTLAIMAFFLIGFNLLALEFALLTPGVRSPAQLFGGATFMALVLAKVMVLAESVLARAVRRTGSFLMAVVQKSLLFTLAMLAALMLEQLAHGIFSLDLSLAGAWEHALKEGSIARFVARFTYLMVLFVLYSFVFELDQYFSPRNLTDVVFSRYHKPQVTDSVAMRIGFIEPPPTEPAEERAAFSRRLYDDVRQLAEANGGHLELFGGAYSFVAWADATTFELGQARAVFDGVADLLQHDPVGKELKLKAGVARGPLLTFEVGSEGQREIVRHGECLEWASALFDEQPDATLHVGASLSQTDT